MNRKTAAALAVLAVAVVAIALAESETRPWQQTVSMGDVLVRLFQVRKSMPQDKVFETLDLQRTKGMMATSTRGFPGLKIFYRTDSSNLLFCLSFRRTQGTHDFNPLLEQVEIYSYKPKTDTSPMIMHGKPLTLTLIKDDSEQAESTVPLEAAPSASSETR